jgi:hypothetical protein
MTMKKAIFYLLTPFLLVACNKGRKIPDVSHISVSVPIDRFDRDFFSIDTNNIPAGLQKLAKQHPDFYPDFMEQVIGVSPSDTSNQTLAATRIFIRGYLPIYDSLQDIYKNVEPLQREIEHAFQYVKYYYPGYNSGKLILFVGPFDAPGIATTKTGLAVGLQQYAGKNFSVYQSEPGQELFPLYISRRFSKEYIVPNAMKAVVDDLYPDQSGGKPLLEQMVEKGKQWWLLDQFLPKTPDSLKTGYTQAQLDWCNEQEGLIWTYLVKNEDLYSVNPTVIQTYIGEGPFTQGFSQDLSPGNLGQWIGWRIVQKYVSKHPGITPDELMKTAPKKIIEEAKYKPR